MNAGHNSGETALQVKALHFRHFNSIEEQKAIVKEAHTELKRRRKVAKSEGVVLANLDYMARCANLQDPEIVPEELRIRAEIAYWFALPVNYQREMFTDRSPMEDRAFNEGLVAGFLGKDPSSPYDGIVGQKWMAGWHEAQEQRREELQASMEKANASAQPDHGEPDFPDEEAA